MPYSPVSAPAEAICRLVDATPRQLDYMARRGLFGDDPEWNAGSGSRRPWHLPFVPEVAWACARLTDLGIDISQLQEVAEIVRARRVKPDGEILVVLTDGPLAARNKRVYGVARMLRLDHWCATTDALERVAAVVLLRSFATVNPSAVGDPSPAESSRPGEDGRHRSAAMPANHSSP